MPPKNQDAAPDAEPVPYVPPVPANRHNRKDTDYIDSKRRSRRYSEPPREKTRLTIVLCLFRTTSHGWKQAPIIIDKRKTTDEQLWSEIRDVFRSEVQTPWSRLFGFKKVKHILPIEFSRNGIPIRSDAKDLPGARQFMHCYHHPTTIRTNHDWVDWFIQFADDSDKTYGLEFVEGLWAEKLALLGILFNIALIGSAIGWALRGGDLQTIFTVMGFVLSGVAADLALLALYLQVTLPNGPS